MSTPKPLENQFEDLSLADNSKTSTSGAGEPPQEERKSRAVAPKRARVDASKPKPSTGRKRLTEAERKAKVAALEKLLDPKLVDPRPWPPREERLNPMSTGVMVYGLYVDQSKLDDFVMSILEPERKPGANECMRLLYGLDAFQQILEDREVDYEMAWVTPRHRQLCPQIPQDEQVTPVLALFRLSKAGLARVPKKENLQVVIDILKVQPTWWEISGFT
ncbi:hypothetical protein C8Q76DRAFT_804242 [Earliella scabrosa]|nr:hypothetical protein C8Q76DRAFT_804242 [Earliella scabrosa]